MKAAALKQVSSMSQEDVRKIALQWIYAVENRFFTPDFAKDSIIAILRLKPPIEIQKRMIDLFYGLG